MHYSNIIKALLMVMAFLWANLLCSQDIALHHEISLHAGINSAALDNAVGPSLSFHYATRAGKILQSETKLFFDSHRGHAFISGNDTRSFAFGLASGIRVNSRPQKSWNPSLLFMLGLAYGSEESVDAGYRDSGVKVAVCMGVSNRVYSKHMISLGYNAVSDIVHSVYLKYGYWF